MNVRVFSGWAFPQNALDGLVHAVIARMASAPPAHEVWLGWSLGGLRALALAAERQQEQGRSLPGHLVLIASTARFCQDESGWPGTEPAVLRALQGRFRRDRAAALAGFHALCAWPDATRESIDARTAASLSLDCDDLAIGLDTLARLDVRPLLSLVRMPVLVLHGGNDRVIPPVVADRLAALLPHATHGTHPTAGHDLPLAEAHWTADQIVAFLSNSSS